MSHDWKHNTPGLDHSTTWNKAQVGIDLFDDEMPEQTCIYIRYEDGTRWAARSVDMTLEEHAKSVLTGWGTRGEVHDYRTTYFGVHIGGHNPRIRTTVN